MAKPKPVKSLNTYLFVYYYVFVFVYLASVDFK